MAGKLTGLELVKIKILGRTTADQVVDEALVAVAIVGCAARPCTQTALPVRFDDGRKRLVIRSSFLERGTECETEIRPVSGRDLLPRE